MLSPRPSLFKFPQLKALTASHVKATKFKAVVDLDVEAGRIRNGATSIHVREASHLPTDTELLPLMEVFTPSEPCLVLLSGSVGEVAIRTWNVRDKRRLWLREVPVKNEDVREARNLRVARVRERTLKNEEADMIFDWLN